jgi:hypothetical protein
VSDRAKELADELRDDGVFVDAADELDRLRAELDALKAERIAVALLAIGAAVGLIVGYLIWGGA